MNVKPWLQAIINRTLLVVTSFILFNERLPKTTLNIQMRNNLSEQVLLCNHKYPAAMDRLRQRSPVHGPCLPVVVLRLFLVAPRLLAAVSRLFAVVQLTSQHGK